MQRARAAAAAPPRHLPLRTTAAAAAAADNDAASASSSTSSATGRRYEVTLKMPIGVVFAQDKTVDRAPVVIESVAPGGHADAAGLRPGDVLVACSAVQLKAGKEGEFEREGYGRRPYDNFEESMIDVEGLKFETVMGALKSNNPRWGKTSVTLVVRRGGEATAAADAADADAAQ